MTTPPPVGPPVGPPPTPVPPPTTPGQVAAYMLYQQQLKEFQNPRPPAVLPPVAIGNTPVPKTEPKWANPCPECGAIFNTPCVGPQGHPLNYLHGPRLILNG